MITVERTLHPVGQGAFFSEKFRDDSGKLIFCAVYDCGNKDQPHLKKVIDSVFEDDDHIDLLFISHFDSDHISGIDYLMQNKVRYGKIVRKRLIDASTTVFVPFRYPAALTVMTGAYQGIANLITRFFENGIKVIGIDNRENLETRSDVSIPVDSLPNHTTHGGTSIGSGTMLVFNPIWIYIPTMMPSRKGLLNDFERELAKANIQWDKIIDDITLKKNQKDLRNVYSRVGKRGSVTAINMNSLLLLSFSPLELHFNHMICWNNIRYCCRSRYYNFNENSSCLYTGDSDMSNKQEFEQIMIFTEQTLERYHQYKWIGPRLGLFQIPHHGSANNYGAHVAVHRGSRHKGYIAAFVNYHPAKNVFSRRVKIDFLIVGKPLLHVTDNPLTEVIQVMGIN
ncbi:MAG: hypothetical protein IJ808_01350 [Muribaculaceae bacterium]|nr:hypothetical protein [Muribaculaceae bacterium]